MPLPPLRYIAVKRSPTAELIKSYNNALSNMMRTAVAPDYHQQCTVTIVYPGIKPGEWHEWRCPSRGQHWIHCDINGAPIGTTEDVMWLRDQWKTATA